MYKWAVLFENSNFFPMLNEQACKQFIQTKNDFSVRKYVNLETGRYNVYIHGSGDDGESKVIKGYWADNTIEENE